MKLIAEIERVSPYYGILKNEVNIPELVQEFEKNGADTISLVTVPAFGGDKQWVKQAREVTKLPIMVRDFLRTIEEVKEYKDLGADMITFCSELFLPEELDNLVYYAGYIGIKPVVEVNSIYGIKSALKTDTNAIIINNRNIRSGELAMMTTFSAIPLIPDKYEIMTMGGYDDNFNYLEVLESMGEVDHILLGKVLMQSLNLAGTFKHIHEHVQKGKRPH